MDDKRLRPGPPRHCRSLSAEELAAMSTQATETTEQVVGRLRAEGLDERLTAYLVLGRQPGGEERILPGETRDDAAARLQRHYGWDERTAQFTISISLGQGDVVALDEGEEVGDRVTDPRFPFGQDDDEVALDPDGERRDG